MSAIMTRITLPGCRSGWGWLEHDRQSAETMIAAIRRHAAHLREQVEAIEAMPDEGFQIDVVRGSAVQHHVAVVQEAAKP